MKKYLSFLLSMCLVVSCFTNCIKGNFNKELETFKEWYRETSFYQYTPQNMSEFEAYEMDYVLDEFVGLKVSKRILDENLILDINKVTIDDFINAYDNSNASYPYQLVNPELGGGTGLQLKSGYQNATVTVKKEYLTGVKAGTTEYTVYMYLSNYSLKNYMLKSGTKPIADMIKEIILEFGSQHIIATITGNVFGTALALALDIYDAAEMIYNQYNINIGNNLANSNKKGIVQTSLTSRSITEWTSNTISYQYVNNSDVKIQSEVAMYKDGE